MKKILRLLWLLPITAFTQEPVVHWAGSFGGPFYDSALAMSVDASGNFYLTGGFQGTVDFNIQSGTATMTNTDAADAYLLKYDNNGQLQWNVRFGGNYSSFGMGVGTDTAGNVYSTGGFNATVDFNPGASIFNLSASTSPFVYSDVYLSKLSSSGAFSYAKQFSGVGVKDISAYAVDPSGNTYTAGYFNGVTNFSGTSLMPTNGTADIFVYDMFITKSDPSGNLLWVKQIGNGSLSQRAESIVVDASGNLYLCGQFHEVTDFDPSPTSQTILTPHTVGAMELFVMKLDSNGNLLWVRQMGGTQSNTANDMAMDALGNLYLTGSYFGTIDFDPGAGTQSLTTPVNSGFWGYVLQLDANGNFGWVHSLNGNSVGNSITVHPSGKIALTGSFYNSCDFSGGAATAIRTTAGGSDAFIAEFSTGGTFNWVKVLGGTGDDIGRAINTDPAGSYFVFGDFAGMATMETTTFTSNGNNDMFIVKLSDALSTAEYPSAVITLWPSPANGELHLNLSDSLSGGNLSIYSVTGQLVRRQLADDTIDVSVLPAGAYVVKVEKDGVVGRELFLKE